MQELLALLNAGPPPLSALALNRCDLTESSISALATACPNLEVKMFPTNFLPSKTLTLFTQIIWVASNMVCFRENLCFFSGNWSALFTRYSRRAWYSSQHRSSFPGLSDQSLKSWSFHFNWRYQSTLPFSSWIVYLLDFFLIFSICGSLPRIWLFWVHFFPICRTWRVYQQLRWVSSKPPKG